MTETVEQKFIGYSLKNNQPKIVINERQLHVVRKHELLLGERLFRFVPTTKGQLRVIK